MNTDLRTSEPATLAFDKATGLALLDNVLSGVNFAVLVVDEAQKVFWANRAFSAFTGLEPDAFLAGLSDSLTLMMQH